MPKYEDESIPVEDSGEGPLGTTEKEIAERTRDLQQRLESILWGNEKPSGDIPFSGDPIEAFFENVGEGAAQNDTTLEQSVEEHEPDQSLQLTYAVEKPSIDLAERRPRSREDIIREVRRRNRKKYMTSKYLELAETCLAFCKRQPQKYQSTIHFLNRYLDPNEELDEANHQAAARIFEKYKYLVQKPRLYSRIEDAKEKAQLKVHSGVGNRLAEIANARACNVMKQYLK